LKIVTEIKPKTSGSRVRNLYLRKVHAALEAIAELRSTDRDTVSETVIVLGLVDELDAKSTREAVRDAFQLLTDMGIASPVFDTKGRRLTTLWAFHEDFTPANVADVTGWDGREEAFREEGQKAEH
jgi:hypothetical protein